MKLGMEVGINPGHLARLPVQGNAAEIRRQCLQTTSVRGSEVGQMDVIIDYRGPPNGWASTSPKL